MNFIRTGHQNRDQDRQRVSRRTAAQPINVVAKRQPEPPKADQRQRAVAGKVPHLAQNMMREAPVAIHRCAQKAMQEIVQWLRSMVGAEIRSGFGCKDK